MSSPSIEFCTQDYSARLEFSSVEWALIKFNQKPVGCFHNIHTSIAVGKSCQISCCGSQGAQLGKTLDDFSVLEAYIAPSVS